MGNAIDYRREPALSRESPRWAVRAVVLLACAGCGLFGYGFGYQHGWEGGVGYQAAGAADNFNELAKRLATRPAVARTAPAR